MSVAENLQHEKINIEATNNNNQVQIQLNGEVDMEDPSVILRPYLDRLHDSLIQNSIKLVEVNFKGTSFMNSSGIKEFVHWIMKLNNLSPENKYKIRIVYDQSVTWQSSSLPVLQKLQPEMIELDAK